MRQLISLVAGNWFARADVSYRDEQFIDEINLEYLEPQTLANLRVGIDTGSLRLTGICRQRFRQ